MSLQIINVKLKVSVKKEKKRRSSALWGDQLSQILSLAPMQPGSSSLLQIESSLPAHAAKQLSTTLQAIIATLSHSECWLDFHYNARCHSCFSLGGLWGYWKSLYL